MSQKLHFFGFHLHFVMINTSGIDEMSLLIKMNFDYEIVLAGNLLTFEADFFKRR